MDGWGYKKIANYLTEQGVPTPRMSEQMRKEAEGEEYQRARSRAAWAIVTVQGILDNDFYIGTLRQGKYHPRQDQRQGCAARRRTSTSSSRTTISRSSTTARLPPPVLCGRSAPRSNYRGIKKYDNVYSGFLVCGDCGSTDVRDEPLGHSLRPIPAAPITAADERAAPATISAWTSWTSLCVCTSAV